MLLSKLYLAVDVRVFEGIAHVRASKCVVVLC
jgi:hypothetical protein